MAKKTNSDKAPPKGMRKLEAKNRWVQFAEGVRVHGRALNVMTFPGDDGKERAVIKAKLFDECKVKIDDREVMAKAGDVVAIDVKADLIPLRELVDAGEKPEFLIDCGAKVKQGKKSRWTMDLYVDENVGNDEIPF